MMSRKWVDPCKNEIMEKEKMKRKIRRRWKWMMNEKKKKKKKKEEKSSVLMRFVLRWEAESGIESSDG